MPEPLLSKPLRQAIEELERANKEYEDVGKGKYIGATGNTTDAHKTEATHFYKRGLNAEEAKNQAAVQKLYEAAHKVRVLMDFAELPPASVADVPLDTRLKSFQRGRGNDTSLHAIYNFASQVEISASFDKHEYLARNISWRTFGADAFNLKDKDIKDAKKFVPHDPKSDTKTTVETEKVLVLDHAPERFDQYRNAEFKDVDDKVAGATGVDNPDAKEAIAASQVAPFLSAARYALGEGTQPEWPADAKDKTEDRKKFFEDLNSRFNSAERMFAAALEQDLEEDSKTELLQKTFDDAKATNPFPAGDRATQEDALRAAFLRVFPKPLDIKKVSDTKVSDRKVSDDEWYLLAKDQAYTQVFAKLAEDPTATTTSLKTENNLEVKVPYKKEDETLGEVTSDLGINGAATGTVLYDEAVKLIRGAILEHKYNTYRELMSKAAIQEWDEIRALQIQEADDEKKVTEAIEKIRGTQPDRFIQRMQAMVPEHKFTADEEKSIKAYLAKPRTSAALQVWREAQDDVFKQRLKRGFSETGRLAMLLATREQSYDPWAPVDLSLFIKTEEHHDEKYAARMLGGIQGFIAGLDKGEEVYHEPGYLFGQNDRKTTVTYRLADEKDRRKKDGLLLVVSFEGDGEGAAKGAVLNLISFVNNQLKDHPQDKGKYFILVSGGNTFLRDKRREHTCVMAAMAGVRLEGEPQTTVEKELFKASKVANPFQRMQIVQVGLAGGTGFWGYVRWSVGFSFVRSQISDKHYKDAFLIWESEAAAHTTETYRQIDEVTAKGYKEYNPPPPLGVIETAEEIVQRKSKAMVDAVVDIIDKRNEIKDEEKDTDVAMFTRHISALHLVRHALAELNSEFDTKNAAGVRQAPTESQLSHRKAYATQKLIKLVTILRALENRKINAYEDHRASYEKNMYRAAGPTLGWDYARHAIAMLFSDNNLDYKAVCVIQAGLIIANIIGEVPGMTTAQAGEELKAYGIDPASIPKPGSSNDANVKAFRDSLVEAIKARLTTAAAEEKTQELRTLTDKDKKSAGKKLVDEHAERAGKTHTGGMPVPKPRVKDAKGFITPVPLTTIPTNRGS